MTDNELATQKMLTTLASDIAEIRRIVEEDHKRLVGNGKPGLLDRVLLLETSARTAVWVIRTVCAVGGFAVGCAVNWLASH